MRGMPYDAANTNVRIISPFPRPFPFREFRGFCRFPMRTNGIIIRE